MSNKTQLQTNNTTLDALITRVNAAKDVAASLPEAGTGGTTEDLTEELTEYTSLNEELEAVINSLPDAGGGSGGANFETSVVTLNIPVLCKYLGTDLQPKEETTSTFETIKNSIAFISGTEVSVSGCLFLLASGRTAGFVVQLTESVASITLSLGGAAD